ncbi:hypothetical protein FD13_GL001825 [Levilactobacillus senmaizukei DSM 21775 = NBRC 103853]|uniref:DUF2179 domain-containing protein n=1 Tax=Levilactobacillus senmaizukei DSM 21775 = NBRC 103853 TaxID=1423803 RepID=A0A0R2DF72_9LACO|nr:YitT family protein [Levilactobacillus senmaizukei]KRN02601.1 hypothetical protein FD13_GL001825 [Levilactobacillus senmaizukei DSM 21775 = NBRC 103853]
MENMRQLMQRHVYTIKFSVAFFYGVLVSLAVNYFWTPGHIYSSGVTGLAQLINTLTMHAGVWHISTGLGLFLINIPMFVLAWKQVGKTFTFFTFICVVFASVMIRLIQPIHLTNDPIICAIFGGAINGFGVGFALKNGISTGGLDIIGIVVRRKTGHSIGSVNMAFNSLIVLSAGFVYGWPYALYSALGLYVSARVIDMTFTRQQQLQVMIITDRPKTVIDCIQNHLQRGITIVHDVEGAYHHDEKTILFTIITRYEMEGLETAMEEGDPDAFVSISPTIKVLGHFTESKW